MLAWKFLAETNSSTACSPITPKLDTFNPVQGFVKHRVRIMSGVEGWVMSVCLGRTHFEVTTMSKYLTYIHASKVEDCLTYDHM